MLSGIGQGCLRLFLRALTLGHVLCIRVLRKWRRSPVSQQRPSTVMLTGTFHSENWLAAHVRPLLESSHCGKVVVVAASPMRLERHPKLHLEFPPEWLRARVGPVPARLLTFCYLVLKQKPDVVGGFHLLFNGMFASLLARIVGARSLYFCVGGPTEVFHGGRTENRLFARLGGPDEKIERNLLLVVNEMDQVVTMGPGAKRFFQDHGVTTRIEVNPGGIIRPSSALVDRSAKYDLIFVGRLVPVKDVFLYLNVVAWLQSRMPRMRAAIVGDGPLRSDLEEYARKLNITEHVTFTGQQSDVDSILRSARIFLLTSYSEGVSLALMEALGAGLPAIVPDVGDLRAAVVDGVNGFVIADRSPEPFGLRAYELLQAPQLYANFSNAARASAERFGLAAATKVWDEVLPQPAG